jgi:hypothetical protein
MLPRHYEASLCDTIPLGSAGVATCNGIAECEYDELEASAAAAKFDRE